MSPALEVDPDYACAPAVPVTAQKAAACNNRGYVVAVDADLGVTLGIKGQQGCLLEKDGYYDYAVNLPDAIMPGKPYATTTDSENCQLFNIRSGGSVECKDDTTNCVAFVSPTYKNCMFPPDPACGYAGYFKSSCRKTFGYCEEGTTYLEGIDALGRKTSQAGVGVLTLRGTQLVDTNLNGGTAGTLFKENGKEFTLGGVTLEIRQDSRKTQLSHCARCDYPFTGRYCEASLAEPSKKINVLIVVFFQGAQRDAVKASIDQYQQDLRTFEGKSSDVLYWDIPKSSALRPHRELRHKLKTEYMYRHIEAAVFVGDFPAAWVVHNNFEAGQRQSDPSMLYFQAFSGGQIFDDSDCDEKMTLPKGNLANVRLDIAIGVLNQGTPSDIVKYFERLHAHREAGGHPSQKQWSFNEGDWNCDNPTPLYKEDTFTNGHFCFSGAKNESDNQAKYLNMVNDEDVEFEYYNARSHSWHAGFGFGSTVNELWGKAYNGISFYNLFHCSSARYIEKNLAAMMALSTKRGIASVGCTHTGAMLSNDLFEQKLGEAYSWGEAFTWWFNNRGLSYENWHTGMTVYGDPMVRLRGGRIRTTSMLELEEPPADHEFIIDGATLKQLERLVRVDVKLEGQHSDEDLSEKEYLRYERQLK